MFSTDFRVPTPLPELVADPRVGLPYLVGDHILWVGRRENHMDWTTEAIDQLRAFWAEGHSTAEIGRRMGISKNAVVGKAHRLNLPARPSPIRREAEGAEAAPRPVRAAAPPAGAARPGRRTAACAEAAPLAPAGSPAAVAAPWSPRRRRRPWWCGPSRAPPPATAAGRWASPARRISASARATRRPGSRIAPSMPRSPMSGCASAARTRRNTDPRWTEMAGPGRMTGRGKQQRPARNAGLRSARLVKRRAAAMLRG